MINELQKETLSSSASSVASATDIYVDAMDILNEEQSSKMSFHLHKESILNYFRWFISTNSLWSIYKNNH